MLPKYDLDLRFELQGLRDTYRDPTWLPEGNGFTFIYNGQIINHVFRDALDGLARPILQGRFSDPSWSRDGNWLAFSYRPATNGSGWNLYKASRDGTYTEKLSLVEPASGPSWAPFSPFIAFADNETVYLLNLDTQAEYTLISPGLSASGPSPAWSPDGQSIAFVERGTVHNELNVIEVATGITNTVDINFERIETPTWSPSGDWIVFSAALPNTRSQLYKVRIDGSSLIQLTTLDNCQPSEPSWSPLLQNVH